MTIQFNTTIPGKEKKRKPISWNGELGIYSLKDVIFVINGNSIGDGDGGRGGGGRSGVGLKLVQGGLKPHPLRLIQRKVEISHISLFPY